MWSAALDAILTTLRYIAPATLLTLFWGQQSFLFKILKHIDSAFRAIVFSSEEQKQAVLLWLAEVGPVKVEHLDTVWKHGWILCGVLDTALPGACAGHPPTRLSLKHAQAIADHYLGVEPVFSRQELESNDSLSKHQEWKLATYLERIREALAKLTPPVSKGTSQRSSPETTQFTLDYVAKGSGLTAAQINNKMRFKIYPTSQQCLDPGEITILIRGPKDTYGMTVMPPLLGKAQLIRHKLLGLQSKQNFTENVLPITQGAGYLRSYGKNDMNKTYYIPKTKYDIDINVETKPDHAKISYEVNLEGKYEIFITSRGQNIVGSPFMITASHNILGLLERDSFCLEDGEEIDIVDVKNDRKVVLRIVDFVTEKMLLKENGTLEKISDEEANILMATSSINKSPFKSTKISDHVTEQEASIKEKSNKFNKAANKVIKMKRVCKIMHDLVKQSQIAQDSTFMHSKNQQYIPDIVNSTFSDINTNPFIVNEKRNKYIVPESISVSLRTEKSIPFIEEMGHVSIESNRSLASLDSENTKNTPDSLEKSSMSQEDLIEDDMSIDRMTPLSANNPFLSDISEENFIKEKDLGTFVTSEYETNNCQNEETDSIKIVIDSHFTPPRSPNNPFIDDDLRNIERPKSPMFRLLEEATLHDDSDTDPKSELIPEEMLGNEFINPFFTHHHHQPHEQLPIADFIIGAPVSLPPILRASSPEPHMRSLIITRSEKSDGFNVKENIQRRENKVAEITPSTNTTSSHISLDLHKMGSASSISPTFQSFESNFTEPLETSASSVSDGNYEPFRTDSSQERNVTPRRETWDSAYVSIDDNNSSPDSNNNENTALYEAINKQKVSPNEENYGFKQDELSNMGPAEREIWQTCSELYDNKPHEETKPHKMEIKRPLFTPIIEETDKNISPGSKDFTETEKDPETDPVTVAFSELNDIYTDYFPGSETESTTVAVEDNKLNSIEVDFTVETNEISVDSASEIMSDVKRHENQTEGTISEVQSNVTESVSVSQILPDETNQQSRKQRAHYKDETQFGDGSRSNIVLERKKYWDEKIRQIEAKSQETAFMYKKKRTPAKQMKHDSLSKKKGKQMIKNFLNAGGYNQSKILQSGEEKPVEIVKYGSSQNINENLSSEAGQSDEKLVEKWKKYWDDKLEKEHVDIETPSVKPRTPTLKEVSVTPEIKSPSKSQAFESSQQIPTIESSDVLDIHEIDHVIQTASTCTPVKQELPEEVFKAFETSPKRFFGTSRQQILSRIDSFTGKPSISEDTSPEASEVNYDTGLVSSRISLFHNLSNTEELPWARRKSKSMHNINQKKDNDKNITISQLNLSMPQQNAGGTIVHESKIKFDIKENNDKHVLENIGKGSVKEKVLNISCETNSLNTYDETRKSPSDPSSIAPMSAYLTNNEILRRKSLSKSEMDIFNKIPTKPADDYLDKYKSCDELPKINVKNFISLYESVSKTALDSKPNKLYRTSSGDSDKLLHTISKTRDAVKELDATEHRTVEIKLTSSNESQNRTNSPKISPKKLVSYKSLETLDTESTDKAENESLHIQTTTNEDKETTYVTLSDIELEIVESSPDKSSESSPERIPVAAHIEYKHRFKSAKEYFQSLEELREVRKPRKLNECELLLKQSSESPEDGRPRRKRKTKSHSMPSSEISKIWNQMQENQQEDSEAGSSKLVKISEKFNVDDLFTDVMEGKLSRQGSLRGIPHKKAVLEAFRSMENLANNQVTSYEIAETQLNDFAKENKIKNAQTYLSEYPYLPTTDPSKYQSRLDTKASGLISFKELLDKRPRRNSVPDLRLNPQFEVDL